MTLDSFEDQPEAALESARAAGRVIFLTRRGRSFACVTPDGVPGPGSDWIRSAQALLDALPDEVREVAVQLLEDGFPEGLEAACAAALLVVKER